MGQAWTIPVQGLIPIGRWGCSPDEEVLEEPDPPLEEPPPEAERPTSES